MGLDVVDLMMGVEEAFGVEIPDWDAATLDTVGKLFDYVWTRVERWQTAAGPCRSSVLFYRTRQALMDLSGVPGSGSGRRPR